MSETFTLDDGSIFKVDPTVKNLPCPCGGKFSIGHVVSAPKALELPVGMPVGFHSSPHCKRYEEMDLVDFMRWIRLNNSVIDGGKK